MRWILLLVSFSSFAFAEDKVWERHEIPNTSCADGTPYAIFISQGSEPNLYFKFSGGNACWDYKSCYDKEYANLTTVVEAPTNYFTEYEESPIKEDTQVLLTYCTGDVHIGEHITHYDGVITNHNGKQNIENAFAYLEEYLGGMNRYDRVILHGFSAGALGLLYHLHSFQNYVREVENKMAIFDGAGLHFGDDFWNRFPPLQIQDYSQVLTLNGLSAELPLKGNISAAIKNVCSMMPDWRMGVLQTSKDIVMSFFFGEISTRKHKKLVYSEDGVLGHTENPDDNCVGFLPDSRRHTLLSTEKKAGTRAENEAGEKKTTMEFITGFISGLINETYWD